MGGGDNRSQMDRMSALSKRTGLSLRSGASFAHNLKQGKNRLNRTVDDVQVIEEENGNEEEQNEDANDA